MAAGLGFKTFTTGEVLTAADVNGYLMQGVLVFASEAARNSAITSPQEGQFAYTKDNNSLWYYTGSAWAASGATGDIEGVTAGVGISGGGTSGTVTITNDMATTITASGDIVVGTGSGTYDNLPIGSTGQVLTADTTVSPYKVKWDTPASGGGMTLLETLTLSGASVTSSSIAGTYKNLALFVVNYKPANDGEELQMRINSDSNANRYHYSTNTSTINTAFAFSSMRISVGNDNSTATGLVYAELYDYANTATWKTCMSQSLSNSASDATQLNYQIIWSAYNQTGAITTLTFLPQNGNFTSGSVLIYGVS